MIAEILERNSMTFPYGVTPEVAVDEATEDDRGADTVNRLLLHGARYHDRNGVFRDWTALRGGRTGWDTTPDWRADRRALRIGLVLRQRLAVDKGDSVAMWMPFGLEWPVIERGIWSIGGISVAVHTNWTFEQIADVLRDSAPIALFAPNFRSYEQLRVLGGIPDSVQAVIVLDGTGLDNEEAENEQALAYERFLDYGGVLDTPERASMWRTSARSIRAGDLVTSEYGFGPEGMSRQDLTNEELVDGIRALLEKVPPQPAKVQALASEEPFIILRLLAYAGWADGLTISAFAGSAEAREELAELAPSLVACSAEDLPALRAAVRSADTAGSSSRVVLLGDATDSDGVSSAARILDVNIAEFDGIDPGQVYPFVEDGNE